MPDGAEVQEAWGGGFLPLPLPAAGSKPAPPAHHLGHRDRLRERVLNAGFPALHDYEALELYLYRSIPRRDIKPLAKALLARFGSLSAVLSASIDDLCRINGVGETVAMDLKLVHELAQRIGLEPLHRRTVISSWNALLSYVRIAMAHEPREQFRVLFLDKKNQLIADEVMNEGTVDHAPVYPREIARRALELSSCACILVHNHPSGDPTPSEADIAMTLEVVSACRPLRIAIHDHLVVGRDGVASFKALGLF